MDTDSVSKDLKGSKSWADLPRDTSPLRPSAPASSYRSISASAADSSIPTLPETSQRTSLPISALNSIAFSQSASLAPLSPSINLVPRNRIVSGQNNVSYPNPMTPINFRATDPSEWTLSRVLNWLEFNKFGTDWVETFKTKNIHGQEFLSLVSYARLKKELGKDLSQLSTSNDIYSTTPSRFIQILRKVLDKSSSNTSQSSGYEAARESGIWYKDDSDAEAPTYAHEGFHSNSMCPEHPAYIDAIKISNQYHNSSTASPLSNTQTHDRSTPATSTSTSSKDIPKHQPVIFPSPSLSPASPDVARLPVQRNGSFDNLKDIDPTQVRVRSRSKHKSDPQILNSYELPFQNPHLHQHRQASAGEVLGSNSNDISSSSPLPTKHQAIPSSPTTFASIFSRNKHSKSLSSDAPIDNTDPAYAPANITSDTTTSKTNETESPSSLSSSASVEKLSPNINSGNTTSTPVASSSSTQLPEKHERLEKNVNTVSRHDKVEPTKPLNEKEKRSGGGLLNKLRRRDKDSSNAHVSKDNNKDIRLLTNKSYSNFFDLPSSGSISPVKFFEPATSPLKPGNNSSSSATPTKPFKPLGFNQISNSPTLSSSPVTSSSSSSISSIFSNGYLSKKYAPVKLTPDAEPSSATSSNSNSQSAVARTYVLVTTTNKSFTQIDITEASDLESAKVLILTTLGFPCSEDKNDTSDDAQVKFSKHTCLPSDFSFHLTDFGCSEGHVLDDSILSKLLLQPEKLGIPTSEPIRFYITGTWVDIFNEKMSSFQQQIFDDILQPEIEDIPKQSLSLFKPSYVPNSPGQISLVYETATNTSHYPTTPSHLIYDESKGIHPTNNDYFSHKPSPAAENADDIKLSLQSQASSLIPKIPNSQSPPTVPILTQQQQISFQEYIMNSHKGSTSSNTANVGTTSSFSGPSSHTNAPKASISSVPSAPHSRPVSYISSSPNSRPVSTVSPDLSATGNTHHLSIPFSGALGHFSNFASFVQQPGFSNSNTSHHDFPAPGISGIPSYSHRESIRSSFASIDYSNRRSSEDSFKVIRPERREINFDDRRSSPYDRRRLTSGTGTIATGTSISGPSGNNLHMPSKPLQGYHLSTTVTHSKLDPASETNKPIQTTDLIDPSETILTKSTMLQRGPQMNRQTSKSERRKSAQQFIARRNAPPPPSQSLQRVSSQDRHQFSEDSQLYRNRLNYQGADLHTSAGGNEPDDLHRKNIFKEPKLTITEAPSANTTKNSNPKGLVVNATRRPSGEGVSDSTGKLSPKISPTSPAFDKKLRSISPTTPTLSSFENNKTHDNVADKHFPGNMLLTPEDASYSPRFITKNNQGNDKTKHVNFDSGSVTIPDYSDGDNSVVSTLNDYQKQDLLQQIPTITQDQENNNNNDGNKADPLHLDPKDFDSVGLSQDLLKLNAADNNHSDRAQNNSNSTASVHFATPVVTADEEYNAHSSFEHSIHFYGNKRCSLASVKEEEPPSPKSPLVALVRQPSVRMPHRSSIIPSQPHGNLAVPPSHSLPPPHFDSQIPEDTGYEANNEGGKPKATDAALASTKTENDSKFYENEISFEGAPELEESSDDDSSSSDEGLWAKKPPKPSSSNEPDSSSPAIPQSSISTTNSADVDGYGKNGVNSSSSKISADFDNGTDDESDSDEENDNGHNLSASTSASNFSKNNNFNVNESIDPKQKQITPSTASTHKKALQPQLQNITLTDSGVLPRQQALVKNVSTASAASIQRHSQHSNSQQHVPNVAPSAAAAARARPHLFVDVTKTRGFSVPASMADLGMMSRGGVVGKAPFAGNYLTDQQQHSGSKPAFKDSSDALSSKALPGSSPSENSRISNEEEEDLSASNVAGSGVVPPSPSLDKLTFSDTNLGGWAVRPPAEVVYENLERFFPNADLDRPIILDPQGVSPPVSPSVGHSNTGIGSQPSSVTTIHTDTSDEADTDTSVAEDSNNSFNKPQTGGLGNTRYPTASRSENHNSPLSLADESNKLNQIPSRLSPSGPGKENAVPVQQIRQQGQAPPGQKAEKTTLSSQQRSQLSNYPPKSNLTSEKTPDNIQSESQQTQNPASISGTHSTEVDLSKSASQPSSENVQEELNTKHTRRSQAKGNLSMRTKSLRIVALEATERRKKFQSLANMSNQSGGRGIAGSSTRGGGAPPSGVVMGGSPGALLRRKSTKMWGQKVVEVKPSQFQKGNSNQQLSRLRDNRGKVKQFVWVKGELIGKGTFGKVYLAFNVTAGEMIAVKQVEVPQTLSDKNSELQKEVIGALHAEVETMKDLDHFNIVQYLGFEALPDTYNLFLEYIPGGTVGMALRKNGRFETSVSQYFTRQVLDGLSYLHSCGILHRDLKSDNILIDLDGVCKISDFGISKKSGNIYVNDAQMSMQGTIFWMAPEVIHNVVDNEKLGYSAKVDIWSLGCVVLEMFAGRRPWSTDEAIGAMYKLGNARLAPPIPEDTKPFVTTTGKNFLDLCFQINPEQRPTAKQLLDHPFCAVDPNFRFADTQLAKMIRVDDKEKAKMRETKMNKK